MIGQSIGQFVITQKLGEGSMGEVYKARDTLVNRDVAIKLLRRDLASLSNVVERFQREAESLAQLNHPNIAGLYTFFQHQQGHVMAIEYVQGRTLERILHDHGPLDEPTATGVAFQILAALQHAHALGVIHRDIKPANIIVSDAGAVKVTDFSIAKIVGGAKLTKRGSIVGTMEYMAPERLQGHNSDHRADIYATGAVLYETLTGHVPFEHQREVDLIQAHIRDQPPPMATHGRAISPAVEAVTLRALAKDPAARFASASEFQQALSHALSGAPASHPTKPSPTGVPSPWSRFANYTIPLPGVPAQFSTAPIIAAATLVSILLVAAIVMALIPSTPTVAAPAAATPIQPPPTMQPAPEPPATVNRFDPSQGIPIEQPGGVLPPAPEPPGDADERRRKSLEALGIEGNP